jgi:GNAT superfamily N-acetyltransferase
MEFKRYTSKDIDLVKKFLLDCKYEGGVTDRVLKQDTSILAYDDKTNLVGFAMQWRNDLHDKTVTIELCVHPNERKMGLGTKLFNLVLEEFPLKESDFAIDVMLNSNNIEAQKFFEGLGMTNYLKCYSNIFEIKNMKSVDSDLKVVKLSDFYKFSENKEKIKIFHCSLYDRDHEPFVPVTKDKEVRYDYYSDGEHDFGVVLLKNDEIVGCSFAYLDFENETEEKGVTCLHGYAVGDNVQEEALRVQSLYTHQMNLLKKKGVERVYIEFDSIERISDLMLEWIPSTKAPLLRFQKRF